MRELEELTLKKEEEEELVTNDNIFLEDAGLVTSFNELMDKEILEERLYVRRLIITVSLLVFLVGIWPVALRPAMTSFFDWARNWGYLSLGSKQT